MNFLTRVLGFTVLMFSSNPTIDVIFVTDVTAGICLSRAVPCAALNVVRGPEEEVRAEACSERQL